MPMLGLERPLIWASSQVFLPLKTLASKNDSPVFMADIVVIAVPFSWVVMMISRPMKSSEGLVNWLALTSTAASVWLRRLKLVRLEPKVTYSVVNTPCIPCKLGICSRSPGRKTLSGWILLRLINSSSVVSKRCAIHESVSPDCTI